MSAPGMMRRATTTRSDWETPSELFDQLDRMFQFTLDAAADERNRKCGQWLEGPCQLSDTCNCGLCADWLDQTVYCNPPYADLKPWVRKFSASALRGATVVALLPNATETVWGAHVLTFASEVWFLTPRVQFVGSTSSNPSGSMIAIYRPEMPNMQPSRPHVRVWGWKRWNERTANSSGVEEAPREGF